MDEPELPPLPAPRSTLPPRKRTHTEYDTHTSSDPALFSSDDHKEASADLYVSKRRKAKWTGTWWGGRLETTSSRAAKRSFQRNYDSGIFMGSEGTDTSLEDDFLADQQLKGDAAVTSRSSSPAFVGGGYSSPLKKVAAASVQPRLVSSGHYQAVATIQRCLEAGSENVDLSYVSLAIYVCCLLTHFSDRCISTYCLPKFHSSSLLQSTLAFPIFLQLIKRIPLSKPSYVSTSVTMLFFGFRQLYSSWRIFVCLACGRTTFHIFRPECAGL